MWPATSLSPQLAWMSRGKMLLVQNNFAQNYVMP
uniref:Gustatory receptor n=1 Tax=Anoplophora chinensis TaxID=217632 RepID=A0A2H4ZBC6_ANOCN|nr:gustatory receptor [Anoplophora chinensis]